jgi:hypothetical protein
MKKKNTISLKTAKKWAKKWRKQEGTYNKHHDCRAFNIPKIDLQEVLAEDGVANIRAYLGIDDNNEEKLMIVGVDANGKDMISKKSSGLGDEEGDDIYDFTKPCPTHCDPSSPLNG